jgi:hypothetical protein
MDLEERALAMPDHAEDLDVVLARQMPAQVEHGTDGAARPVRVLQQEADPRPPSRRRRAAGRHHRPEEYE